jgi:leader peptidase (prepilin peptidase)/N-methyltransferase
LPELFYYIYVFAIAASIGSFLNVCIYRLPMGKSIVSPSSSCPNCNNLIKFYDNIPILSYLLLRGKCRGCALPISIEYPLIEALTGLLALALFCSFGYSVEFFVFSFLAFALIVITFIDLRHRIIPNVITLPGILIGFACHVYLSSPFIMGGVITSALGIIIGGGILMIIAYSYHLLTKKHGMGGGDIKLLAMLGAFLGWKGALFTLFGASVIGAVIGGGLVLAFGKSSKYAVPFGPFISIGALGYIFFGETLIEWYLFSLWGL